MVVPFKIGFVLLVNNGTGVCDSHTSLADRLSQSAPKQSAARVGEHRRDPIVYVVQVGISGRSAKRPTIEWDSNNGRNENPDRRNGTG